jgi:hypothetical protein
VIAFVFSPEFYLLFLLFYSDYCAMFQSHAAGESIAGTCD